METLREPRAMQAEALQRRRQGHVLALVPTMGYLHEAHLSLVRLAREQADVVIVSLFVNPSQFGPGEDYERYPRDAERDMELLQAEGVDLLFQPEAAAMYPDGHQLYIEEPPAARQLEGLSRPGHFRGMLTVVAKLFHLTLPHRAVFGEKDAQQLFLVQQMVRDLDFPVEVVSGPTLREPDGLAMSSRNAYLNPGERAAAPILKCALDRAAASFDAGATDAEALKKLVAEVVAEEPLASLDYVELVDPSTFAPATVAMPGHLLLVAARLGPTRLLDNLRLGRVSA